MKKFFAAILASLCLVLASCVPAHADVIPEVKASISSPVSVLQATPAVHITKAAASQALGVSASKPNWIILPGYCYVNIFGEYRCYRYACTDWERWFYGCYDGYYTVYNLWWA